MRRPIALMAGILLATAIFHSAAAQTGTSEQQPSQPTVTQIPTPAAKEFEGLDAFSSDGQQIGKVMKAVASPDGKVKEVEIRSGGFLGFFSKTYVVPADKASIKGGRVDLSMTSDQVKQLAK